MLFIPQHCTSGILFACFYFISCYSNPRSLAIYRITCIVQCTPADGIDVVSDSIPATQYRYVGLRRILASRVLVPRRLVAQLLAGMGYTSAITHALPRCIITIYIAAPYNRVRAIRALLGVIQSAAPSAEID
jgi:hypothetical protein